MHIHRNIDGVQKVKGEIKVERYGKERKVHEAASLYCIVCPDQKMTTVSVLVNNPSIHLTIAIYKTNKTNIANQAATHGSEK